MRRPVWVRLACLIYNTAAGRSLSLFHTFHYTDKAPTYDTFLTLPWVPRIFLHFPSTSTHPAPRRRGAPYCRKLPMPLHRREGHGKVWKAPALQGIVLPPRDPRLHVPGRRLHPRKRNWCVNVVRLSLPDRIYFFQSHKLPSKLCPNSPQNMILCIKKHAE